MDAACQAKKRPAAVVRNLLSPYPGFELNRQVGIFYRAGFLALECCLR